MTEIKNCYYFNNNFKKWVNFDEKSEKYYKMISKPYKDKITIANFNILHAQYSRIINWYFQNDNRFEFIVKEIRNIDSDVFGINECTDYFMNYLLKDEFIQENYFLSSLENVNKNSNIIFNLILSKKPFKVLINKNSNRYSIGCHFYEEEYIIFTSHPVAYEENCHKREKELLTFISNLNSYNDKQIQEIIKRGNLILMGDMNAHFLSENHYFNKLGFLDIWMESDQNETNGTTFDMNTSLNSFYIFDNRKMRLDRMLFFKNSDLFEIEKNSMKIIFNKKLNDSWYIYPSDHFGLYSEIKLKTTPSKYDIKNKEFIVKYENEREDLKITGYRTIKEIILYRYLAMIFLIILLKLIYQ